MPLEPTEILARLDVAHDAEHCQIKACPDGPGALAALKVNSGLVAPVAIRLDTSCTAGTAQGQPGSSEQRGGSGGWQ